MKLRWAALAVVLALSALMPRFTAAQTGDPAQKPARRLGSIGQNYPNPFNPETWIPFNVGDPNCTDARQHRVTLRVYNLLAQVVAVPELTAAGAGGAPGGQRIENLTLSCGAYLGYWDGKYLNSSREAASGVYLFRLEVDGRVVWVNKGLVAK